MEGLGSLLLIAVLFFLMMRFGCGAHIMHGSHSHGDNKGAKHIDPVCNMEVEIEQGYGKMFQGTLYRFCSKNCLDKFDDDPEHYLNKDQGEDHDM